MGDLEERTLVVDGELPLVAKLREVCALARVEAGDRVDLAEIGVPLLYLEELLDLAEGKRVPGSGSEAPSDG